MMEAIELFRRLEPIKIGGSVCRYSMRKCEELVVLVNEIEELKKKNNAVVLAHSYVSPDVLYSVADYVGDSYKLSLDAKNTDADVIIFVAVKFMAETAKLLNPSKKVYVASDFNGCSLADSIDGKTVAQLKKDHPDHTFVCYINTTAEVKAMCDVCVTSSNVYDIIEKIDNDKIYFLPDKLMGMNVVEEMKRRGVKKEIAYYEDGMCYVHEEYDPDMIDYLRMEYEDLKVLAHPECSKEVVSKSDYVGSTDGLLKYVRAQGAGNYLLLTECGLLDRVKSEIKDVNLVGSCRYCKYMKSNSLLEIRNTLLGQGKVREVILNDDVLSGAKNCIDRMFEYTRV